MTDLQGGVADPQGGVADQELVRADTDRVGRVLRDGFQKISDSLNVALATVAVTNQVTREVGAQERRWGLKSWPEGTGPTAYPIAPLARWVNANAPELAEVWKAEADILEANQAVTWWDLLLKEVLEVAAEDPSLENQDLDTKLTQVAAVCVSWLKDRAKRRAAAGTPEPERRAHTSGDQK